MRWLYKIFRLFKCPHKYITYDREPYYWDEEGRRQGRYGSIVNYQECVRCGNRRRVQT